MLRRTQAATATSGIPVIVLTDPRFADQIARAQALNVVEVLSKPVDREQLLRAIAGTELWPPFGGSGDADEEVPT